MNQPKLPIWDEKYDKLGVTPRELYMRQNGLCWLIEVQEESGASLYCTDGLDKAKTSYMCNPTYECVRCIASYTEAIINKSE